MYFMPSLSTIGSSELSSARKLITVFTPFSFNNRNPFSVGCPPRYSPSANMPKRGMSPASGPPSIGPAVSIMGNRKRIPIKESIGMRVASPCSIGVYVPSTKVHLKGKSAIERFLSVFATVHRGEGLTALLLTLNVFLLLTAYYIIKPVREALILGSAGAEIKSYTGALQALLFLLIVPLYSAYASRTNRVRLINGVIAFFISNLAIFYVLGRLQFQLGVVFFLWVGLFNLMLVAQFWALANDIYTEEQGRRLFAIVGIGSSLGAIAGARVAGLLFKPIGPYSMMLVTAALLAVCMILTTWIHHREGVANRPRSEAARQPLGNSGGFRLVFRHRYLFLIAILVLLSNL